jgi:hypothetical protein
MIDARKLSRAQCLLRILISFDSGKLLVHLRTLDQGVQHVKNTVASPCLWALAQNLNLLFILPFPCSLLAVGAEAIELVDELIDDIPSPVILCPAYSQSTVPFDLRSTSPSIGPMHSQLVTLNPPAHLSLE